MANDQFQLPESPQAQAESTGPALFDNLQESVEHELPFQFVKNTEQRIDDFRASELTKASQKSAWLRYMPEIILPSKSPQDLQIEREARIGGDMFEQSLGGYKQKFWYHGQYTNTKGDTVGEWIYQEIRQDRSSRVIRYLTTPYGFDKLVDGFRTPFVQNESNTLIAAIMRYEQVVTGRQDEYQLAA